MQLMQQKVQKSRTTILPRKSFSRMGPAVLSQPMPPSSSGASTRSFFSPSAFIGSDSSFFSDALPASSSEAAERMQPETAKHPAISKMVAHCHARIPPQVQEIPQAAALVDMHILPGCENRPSEAPHRSRALFGAGRRHHCRLSHFRLAPWNCTSVIPEGVAEFDD